MNNDIKTPTPWNEHEELVVLRTHDGKPYGLGTTDPSTRQIVALASHDYTRNQIDWLRHTVEDNGGVGSYRGQYRNYIMNVFHGELGLAA